MSDFYREISVCMARSLASFHPDNFDREIKPFGIYRHATAWVERLVRSLGMLLGRDLSALVISRNNFYLKNLDRFEYAYECLCDEESRKKYIELLAYRMLGFTKVKLLLADGRLAQLREQADALKTDQYLPVDRKYGFDRLFLYDLHAVGQDLKLYIGRNGVLNDFIQQQYNYADRVCVVADDVVIDAGGCWGDTALYFAARGAGRVFVYEFIPSNLAIFEKNLALNPCHADCVELVDKAVWEVSGCKLSFDDQGQASRVATEGVYGGTTETLSIDDLVRQRNLPRVDFIKMDIEGAELQALKGAAATIRRFKPKLAIAVYHQPDDMITIPAYIKSLNPGYELYLDYYTTVGDEVILYAMDKHAQ